MKNKIISGNSPVKTVNLKTSSLAESSFESFKMAKNCEKIVCTESVLPIPNYFACKIEGRKKIFIRPDFNVFGPSKQRHFFLALLIEYLSGHEVITNYYRINYTV
jgi:hypothetical protein